MFSFMFTLHSHFVDGGEGGGAKGFEAKPPIHEGLKNIGGADPPPPAGAAAPPSSEEPGAGVGAADVGATGAAGAKGAAAGAPGMGGSSAAVIGDAETPPPLFMTSTYLCLGPRPFDILNAEEGGGGGPAPLGTAVGRLAAPVGDDDGGGVGAMAAALAVEVGFPMTLGGGGGRDDSSPSGLLLSIQRFFSLSQTI